jgi:hypothetical protein
VSAQSQLIEDRIASVGQLFCTASYLQEASEGALGHAPSDAVAIVSEDLATAALPPPEEPNDLYEEMLATRNNAMKDFEEAVNMLHSELILTSAGEDS